jgi:hypothetical protein
VFKKRALKVFIFKENTTTGSWTQLCEEELHNLYTSTDIIVKFGGVRLERHVRPMANKRNA